MRKIPLYHKNGNSRWGQYVPINKYAMVDDDDYQKVLELTQFWILHSEGYAYTNVASKATLMHRWILDLTDSNIHTDHIDHDRLNNQRKNIKACSQAENNANLPFTGVGKRKNKWRAWTPTPTQHLGVFNTKQEAEEALASWFKTGKRTIIARESEKRLSPCCNTTVVRNGKYRSINRFRCTKCRWTFKETEWHEH